jgi:hypothetical protein
LGLRESNSIDFILERTPFETEPCKLILLIVDATAGLDDATRFQLLITKLAGYLVYVCSPALAADHPGVKPEDAIVRVLTVTPPTAGMRNIDSVRSQDGAVRLRVFFYDYHAYMRKVKSMPRPDRPPSEPSSN